MNSTTFVGHTILVLGFQGQTTFPFRVDPAIDPVTTQAFLPTGP